MIAAMKRSQFLTSSITILRAYLSELINKVRRSNGIGVAAGDIRRPPFARSAPEGLALCLICQQAIRNNTHSEFHHVEDRRRFHD
jgi:hypothetical protein